MNVHRELLAELPGVPVGADDPLVLERWTAGRSIEAAAYDTIAGLGADAPEAVAAVEAPGCRALLACHASHPYLIELLRWAGERPDVVLVASTTGPPPPAVLILERLTP